MRYKPKMTIDYRKLLKDTIRGAVWDMDIPPLPGAIDEHGEETGCSPEELQAWLDLALEVLRENEAAARRYYPLTNQRCPHRLAWKRLAPPSTMPRAAHLPIDKAVSH